MAHKAPLKQENFCVYRSAESPAQKGERSAEITANDFAFWDLPNQRRNAGSDRVANINPCGLLRLFFVFILSH
jgi:hypothetical protein